MTAYLTDTHGTETRLPPLLSYELRYADFEGSGALRLRFLYSASMLPALHEARFLRAVHKGRTVFTGIVDDFTVTAGALGLTAELSGRSLEAELMDNECEAAEYAFFSLASLVKTYVEPYSSARLESGEPVTVRSFEVTSGESAWSVVCAFLRLAGLPEPTVTEDGTLYLGKTPPAEHADPGAADRCVLRDRRCDMASEFVVVNRPRRLTARAVDERFAARGGSSRRVLNVDRAMGLASMQELAQNRLLELNRASCTLTLRTRRLFAARPGDTVTVDEPRLGVTGELRVLRVLVYEDEFQSYTEVETDVVI